MIFNELGILEGRLEYLYGKVDYFVIVEANITHSGNPKPLHFMQNMSRYKRYLDKVLYFPFSYDTSKLDLSVKLDKFDYDSPHWEIEKQQRSHILEALNFFDNNDIVIISDVDEIPSHSSIDVMNNIIGKEASSAALEQQMFYYNFKQCQFYPWHGSTVSTVSFAKEHGVQWLRDMRYMMPVIHTGGWHLSYWGSAEHIANKINNFAHQEFNKEEYKDISSIKNKIAAGQDVFDRQGLLRPIDRSLIDPAILSIFEKYSNKG